MYPVRDREYPSIFGGMIRINENNLCFSTVIMYFYTHNLTVSNGMYN